MLFNSFEFAIFFPVVTLLYFILPHKYRWLHLLLASCVFYLAFIPVYIFILFFLITIDYWAGVSIERSYGIRRRFFLIVSIVSACSALFVFKYFNFFNTNFAHLANLLHWNYSIAALKIILPVGLSFHTFQSLSYVIEVYRGKQKAEHNFGIFALYVMFYPQLVAGPIERPQNLLHQFYEVHKFDYDRVMDGLKLMAWGLFKKVVIADRLSILVNQVYASPSEYGSLQLLIATYFFAFQIYCDFSGYSDIAIGSAQVMGFRLMDNFNRPYFSKYISEFWNRWHISLSSWFRDYLYIPLGGSRVSEMRWILNIIIVFLISGLWHGAKWTFVVWGMLNGFYMIAAHLTKNIRNGIVKAVRLHYFPMIHRYVQIFITFHLVLIGWVFFRANSLTDAKYVLLHMFRMNAFRLDNYYVGLGKTEFLIAICAIIFMLIVHMIQRHNRIRHMLMEKPLWFRLVFYTIMLLSLVLFGEYGHQEFIYFQF